MAVKCNIDFAYVEGSVLYLLNLRMDVLRKNWFSEINALWPGQCMSLEITEILYHEKSAFQDIMILQTLVLFI